MKLFNLFGKNRQHDSDYVPDPQEYLAQNQVPSNLRSFYTYIKIIFFLLFPVGFALSFIHVFFFIAAALLSLLISYHYMPLFTELLNTNFKYYLFIIIPPFCISSGFLFAFMLFSQIAYITRG
jgi:hypothetical protein